MQRLLANNPITITNALGALTGGSGNMPGQSTLQLTYDGVDRLTSSVGDAQLSAQKQTHYDLAFAYTPSHNIKHKQLAHTIIEPGSPEVAPSATNFSSDYLYQPARPHLPAQIGDLLIAYDPSGNPTLRRTANTGKLESLVWDDDNRLVDFASGGVHQHNTFDASGNRVRRKSIQSETLFASQYFDVENGTQGVKHVFAGSTRVASELGKFASGPNQVAPTKPGTQYFFHQDHLGSTSVLTAADATVHESLEYFPDGETWIDRGPLKPVNRYLFSGKPFDPDTGFYDFGQRFYEPRTSLWLGVDPAFSDNASMAVARPTNISVLAFAAHNPLRFRDPNGRQLVDIDTNTGKPIVTQPTPNPHPSGIVIPAGSPIDLRPPPPPRARKPALPRQGSIAFSSSADSWCSSRLAATSSLATSWRRSGPREFPGSQT